MEVKNTKQDILSVALDLFSQKGYSAVSIRDICKRVGIKESTAYYHFKNKQDIFDTLQHEFLQIADKYMSTLTSAMQGGGETILDDSFFEKIGSVYIEGFLLDDFCNAFIRLLNIEQFYSESSRKLYVKWMLEMPLDFQSGVFSYLMHIGILPQMDSNYLAVRYYAPIFLYYQQYMLSGDSTDENKQLFRQHAYAHFAEFMKE